MVSSKLVAFLIILSSLNLSFASIKDHVKSFDIWNRWLEVNVEKNDPREDRLAVLHKYGRIKKTAEFTALGPLKLLAEHNGNCDSAIVDALISISKGSNPAIDDTRIVRLIKSLITPELYQNCEELLNLELQKLVETYQKKTELQVLFEELVPNPLRNPLLKNMNDNDRIAIYRSWLEETINEIPTDDLKVEDIAKALKSLSKDDPKCEYKDPFKYDAPLDPKYLSNFRYAFANYLVKPCKQYEDMFGSYFDKLYAIKTVNPKQASIESRVGPAIATNPVILDSQPNDFFTHLYRFKMCQVIMNIAFKEFTSVFNAIQSL